MAKHPLIHYITEARKLGADTPQIISALTGAGWQVHDIIDIILEHKPEVSAAPAVPAEGANIIEVQNISKSYGKILALDKVSLKVKRGTVAALLGPNGAGKTTLIRILTTLLPAAAGRARVAGFDVERDAQQLRSVIGLAGQFAAVDEILTGRENLEMVGRLYHLRPSDAKSRAAELLKQFELDDAADRSVKTYSGGMRRRLDLAASLLFRPKILFLDEPTNGLDPRSRFALWRIIHDLVANGTTVVLTTQYLEEADQLADFIFVIDHGHIIAEGTPDELKRAAGGEVLEIRMTQHSEAPKAAGVIRKFGSEEPHADSNSGIITMPVSRGAAVLPDVIRELDAVRLKLSDIILRRPSLDDVFMKLTGHAAE